MRLLRFCGAVSMAVGLLGPAAANPPPELADYVGARAGQASGGLDALGYVNVNGSYWWNAAEAVCVHMPVSQGRFTSVDVVEPSACGQKVHAKTGAGAGCPSDVSEANRYLYPDCDKPKPAAASGGIPPAAMSACMASADSYQNVTPGTSMVSNGHKKGENWVLSMASGTYRSTCTVSAKGKVIDMNPG